MRKWLKRQRYPPIYYLVKEFPSDFSVTEDFRRPIMSGCELTVN